MIIYKTTAFPGMKRTTEFTTRTTAIEVNLNINLISGAKKETETKNLANPAIKRTTSPTTRTITTRTQNEHHHINASRVKTYESNNRSFVHKPFNPKKQQSQQNRSTNCPVDQGKHYIGKRPKFLQMSASERNAEVKKYFLC